MTTTKSKTAATTTRLEQIPNIGKAIADDLRGIGIREPAALKKQDPYRLYVKLCQETRAYHDPCVLDTFIAAVRFMDGDGNRPWWRYTAERKKSFHKVAPLVLKFKK